MNRFLLLISVLLCGCRQSRQTLNVFTFPDFIDPSIVTDFEKRFDCRIVFDYFNSGDAVMAKLGNGGDAVYDIVCLGDSEVPIFNRLKLLAALRPETLPNLKNLDSEFVRRTSDPDNGHSIPYSWSFMGIFARRTAGAPLDESWDLLFDPAKQNGSFILFDDSRVCISAALCYKGWSVNSTNLTELAEARDLLVEAKRRSLGFDGPVALRNRVRNRTASMVMTLSGVEAMASPDPETYFFVPHEGTVAGLDRLAIPARAPHRELAEQFLNFLLDAEVGAKNAKTLGTATANQAAKALLPLEIQNDSAIYPSPDAMQRLQFIKDVREHAKIYDELWTQIKAK